MATRKHAHVHLGASVRGSMALHRAAQAYAAMLARDYVVPDDVATLAEPVLAHRLLLRPESQVRGVTRAAVVAEVIEASRCRSVTGMREPRAGWWLAALAAVAVLLRTWASVPAVALVLLLAAVNRWWVRRVAHALQVTCSAPAWAYFEEPVDAVVGVADMRTAPVAPATVTVFPGSCGWSGWGCRRCPRS